jgi:hypothetical protein
MCFKLLRARSIMAMSSKGAVSCPGWGTQSSWRPILPPRTRSLPGANAADRARKGKILLSDLRYYLGHGGIGSTPQFFDSKASGDPLISLSPATALPLHPVSARIDFLVNHVLQSSVHSERVYALQKLHDTAFDPVDQGGGELPHYHI